MDENNDELLRVPQRAPVKGGIEREKAAKVRRATALIQEGYKSRGAKALARKSFTISADEIKQQLVDQHPQPQQVDPVPPLPAHAPQLIIDPKDTTFAAAIKAAANGAAPGPSGWNANYLLPLLKDDEARELLASFFQLLINGTLPKQPLLGCFLIPVAKTPVKVRPIALGEVFFRIATRLAHGRVSAAHLEQFFGDIQLAFVPGASETAVHRIVSEAMQPGYAALGVDIANAFNTLDRAKAIQAIFDDPNMAPLWRILHYAYGEVIPLHHVGADGEQLTVASTQGFRQGDLLAGLVFAYAIQPALRAVLAEIPGVKATAIYDDVTFTGPPMLLFQAYRSFCQKMAALGLHVQPAKSFFIALNGEQVTAEAVQEAAQLSIPIERNVRLLGTRIGLDRQTVCNDLLTDMQERYSDFWDGIAHAEMPVQIAMSLLRVVAVPLLGFLMRTTPAQLLTPTAVQFDELVIAAAARKLGVDPGDLQLERMMQLPLRHGGWGLRSVRRVMHFAYVGAYAQAAPYIQSHFSAAAVKASITHIHQVVADEQLLARLPPADATAADVLTHFKQNTPANNLKLQRAFTRHVAKREYTAIRSEHVAAGRKEDVARVTSTAGLSASAFLLAEPTCARTTITDYEFVLAAKMRLGVQLADPQHDCGCPSATRASVTHMFSCKLRGEADIHWRHNLVRDCLQELVSEAGGSVRREPGGLVPNKKTRPDLEVWINDECMLLDVTVKVPTAASYLQVAAVPRQVLRRAEQAKTAKYEQVARNVNATFVPFAMDVFGGFGEQATKFISKLSNHAEDYSGLDRAAFYRRAIESLACALLRGNDRVHRHWLNACRRRARAPALA